MDARTIETRLREIANGADMISTKGILQYTGTDYEWLRRRLKEHSVTAVGHGHGKRYHIHDIAKVLS